MYDKAWYERNKDKKVAYRKMNQQKITDKQRERYNTNEKTRNGRISSYLKYNFGITLVEYNILVEKQNNKCAICGKSETSVLRGKIKNLAVDHCHKTGKIRGLLCQKCNVSLGNFQDRIELLEKAINYLKQTASASEPIAESEV